VVEDGLVVVSPMEGVTAISPVTITGYVRRLEGGLLVIATSGNLVLGEHQVEPAVGTGAWSEFRTTLALDRGPVTVFVGEESAGAGGLEGVTIPITVG
jgi:hypothetical protein